MTEVVDFSAVREMRDYLDRKRVLASFICFTPMQFCAVYHTPEERVRAVLKSEERDGMIFVRKS